MRNVFAGHRKMVNTGFMSPVAGRGLIDGLTNVVVHNVKELLELNSKIHCITLGSSVGLRKKAQIIEEAKKKALKIINLKNPDEFIKKKLEKKAENKKKKESREEKKKKEEAKKAEAKKAEKPKDAQTKPADKTEKAEKAESPDEKTAKDAQKAEMEKVLTKRD